jgi:hypothetical protein
MRHDPFEPDDDQGLCDALTHYMRRLAEEDAGLHPSRSLLAWWIRECARQEAALRMKRASAALLDAATEVASLVDDGLLPEGQRPELDALWDANDEWQEAQLQAYSPTEARGLVRVA